MLLDSIRDAQKQRGWTDGELSRQLGLAQSVWSRINNGQRNITLPFLRAVARVFPELQFQICDYVIKGGNHDTNQKSKSRKATTTPC